MFFIKLGTVLAWLCTLGGLARLALAYWVATTFESQEAMAAASRRYLAAANSGEAIDRAMYTIVFGIVLGVVVQIAKNTRPQMERSTD